MEDWEDEPAPLVLRKEPPKNQWEDEDVDENDVKDSWEDEDEPAVAPVAEPPVVKPETKSVSKPSTKKDKAAQVVKNEPLDPVAEKLRQQRLVEEADYRNTAELFAKKGGDDKSLENFIPKSESDFLEYAELVSQKLRPYEKSFHYIGLLKAVMRLSLTNLKASDAKEVSSSVTAISNEKIKAEKEANAGKKKSGPKKKQLHIGKPGDALIMSRYDTTYDEYDDFM